MHRPDEYLLKGLSRVGLESGMPEEKGAVARMAKLPLLYLDADQTQQFGEWRRSAHRNAGPGWVTKIINEPWAPFDDFVYLAEGYHSAKAPPAEVAGVITSQERYGQIRREPESGRIMVSALLKAPTQKFADLMVLLSGYGQITEDGWTVKLLPMDRKDPRGVASNAFMVENKDELGEFLARSLYLVTEMFEWIKTTDLHMVLKTPVEKINPKSPLYKNRPWKATGPSLLFLNRMPGEKSVPQGGHHASPRPHARRASWKTYTHPRFRNHPNYLKPKANYCKPAFVGDQEKVYEGNIYRVMKPLVDDEVR
jgi:hypothetical protein